MNTIKNINIQSYTAGTIANYDIRKRLQDGQNNSNVSGVGNKKAMPKTDIAEFDFAGAVKAAQYSLAKEIGESVSENKLNALAGVYGSNDFSDDNNFSSNVANAIINWL